MEQKIEHPLEDFIGKRIQIKFRDGAEFRGKLLQVWKYFAVVEDENHLTYSFSYHHIKKMRRYE